MSDERRGSPRHPASLAGELETPEGKAAIAITRDVSAGGLMLFTRATLEVGASIKLTVMFGDAQHVIQGKVLREEPVDPTVSSLWRTKLAVSVELDDPVLKQIFATLAETPAD